MKWAWSHSKKWVLLKAFDQGRTSFTVRLERDMPPKKRSAAASADIDPSKLSVAQLKAELKKRGCPCAGAKADLVSRLQETLNGNSYQ